VSSSVLAFVTTVHAVLLVIHVQRARGAMRVFGALPSAAFGALAWVLTTPAWLAAGVVVHAAWLGVTVGKAGALHPAPVTASPHPLADGNAGPLTHASGPIGFVQAVVLAVIDETDSIRTFRLARPPGFHFEPGQFLMVKVDVSGKSIARCYSISSPPGASGYLEVSVKRQGVVSSALHGSVRAGDSLLIHPPLGRFTMPADGALNLALVAGGIGITPLISMLRHVVATQPARRVTLLYSVRERRNAAFLAELEWLTQRHPQFRLAMTVTAGDEFDGCHRGRMDEAFIRSSVPALKDAVFLICGPLPMIDAVRGTLAALGVAAERVRWEAFEAAAAVANEAAHGRIGETAGRLRLALSGYETQVNPSETLLDAAERAGGRISSFCRAGLCGTCRTRLLSGDVRCDAEALSSAERESGYVLPCVAWAAGDCVLEA
jgi:ferredoxin-NADP reductase